MRSAFLAVALLAGLIVNQTTARAEKYGTIAGAACVPWDTTIAAAKWQTNIGGMEFKSGQSGSISFACPVLLLGDTYIPNLYYSNDGDGATNSYYVQAQFRKKNKSSGSDSVICTIYSSGGTGSDCSQITIDNDTYVYYVYVTVARPGSPSYAIRFNGIDFDIYTP